MQGLTDKQQAVITFISAILISLGAVSAPSGFPQWVAVVLFLLGAFGFAIKEALGGIAPAPVPAPVPAPAAAPVVIPIPQPAGPIITPQYPAGFSLSALKQIGDKVYSNPNYPYNLIYQDPAGWYNIFGVKIAGPSDPVPAGTGAQL